MCHSFRNKIKLSFSIAKCKIVAIILLSPLMSFAQFTSYSSDNNLMSAVYQVDDMNPYEIKTYNRWVHNGVSKYLTLYHLNAARAQENLKAAPGTIIDYHLYVLSDSTEEENGLSQFYLELINTTPKNIKEITFKFSFSNHGTPVYDTKSGDRYCIIKFSNLTGRTKSNTYNDICNTVPYTYHLLDYRKADYFMPFYNKNTSTARLESIYVEYSDGSISTEASLWDNRYLNEKLFDSGPLAPLVQFEQKTADDKEYFNYLLHNHD